ncbi:MAG TPA: HutD family protein [Beijerinckiaceae bacterium]|nr:HutD family protein [Beijerinckiaceae bacterium]
MRVIRRAEQSEMPWKNGGGTTREIAASPAGAALDAFDWRISVARVASDGPFSRFAGIDRSLTVIEGNGMVLDFGDGRSACLTVADPPLAFAGDVPCSARLIDGAIGDLNVMTRRGSWRADVVANASLPLLGDPRTDTLLVYLIEGTARAGASDLCAGDALLLEPGDQAQSITGAPAARVAFVRLIAVNRPSP